MIHQYTTSVFEGQSISQDWLKALKSEAGSAKTSIFHIYTGISDKNLLSQIMKDISDAFPNAHIVGTESGGEIKDGHLAQRGVLVSCLTFEESDVEVKIFDNLGGNERKTGIQLRELIDYLVFSKDKGDLKAVETLLPGALLNTLDMFEELKLCNKDICIFGGYAGNHDADLDNAFVMHNGKFYNNALIAILYFGENLFINASKSAGWEKLGMPFKITKADGNILKEINDIPAAEIYKRYLNIDIDDDFIESTNEFPLAAYVDGEELLRHTNQVTPEGDLLLAGSVMEGWEVYLTFGNPTGIIREVNSRLQEVYDFDAQAVLLYSCYVRKLFWDKFVNLELEPFQKIAPVAGFSTFGEVLRNMNTGQIMEYNITLLSIAMREGPKQPVFGDAPKEDDSALSGQSSLINRLAKLVSSSTSEIQAAYDALAATNAKLEYASQHDALTSLYNRSHTENLIKTLIQKTKEKGTTSSLVMFDIDHFKNVNDTYGHKVGDMVLQEIAHLATSMLNPEKGQFAGRWGGEEFFVLLPYTTEEEVAVSAEKFRKTVENHNFPGAGHLTVSVGIMTIDGSESLVNVYQRIDNALYRAKNDGRNKVMKV